MGGVGSGGSNRKSPSEHLLGGTYRKDRHGRRTLADVPAAELGSVGNAPSWLKGEGRKLWKQLRPELEELGILTSLDRMAFSMLCATWADIRQAEEILQRDGTTFVTRRGLIRPHPAVSIKARLERDFIALSKCFGLTPASRKSLGIHRPEEEEEDPFVAILKSNQRN